MTATGSASDLEIRRLAEADLPAAKELGRLAFGSAPGDSPPLRMDDRYRRWGAFDPAGRLVAKATDGPQRTCWGGQVLETSGIGGVAVEPEWRGRGAARALLTALLTDARARGALVSHLFCTSTAVYRSLGYEIAGALRVVDLPTAALPRVRPAPEVVMRPLAADDWAGVRPVHEQVVRAASGLQLLETAPGDADGVTVVEQAGRPTGYVRWTRGVGYDHTAVLTCEDIQALTPEAAVALLGWCRSWETVAPTVRLAVPPTADALTTLLPLERAREHWAPTWMHRPLDLASAVAARGWSPGLVLDGTVAVRDPLGMVEGAWRLRIDAGQGEAERVGDVAAAGSPDPAYPTLHVRGWSALWCGAGRCAQLRQAGLLTGGSPDSDAALDAVFGADPPAAQLVYF